MGFSNDGLGIDYAMAHTLSAHYDTPHGVACAMLLPLAMEFNLRDSCPFVSYFSPGNRFNALLSLCTIPAIRRSSSQREMGQFLFHDDSFQIS